MSTPTEVTIPTVAPDWATVRQTVSQVRHLGRVYLYGQVWLGWQLSVLKADFSHGGSRRSSRQIGDLKSWKQTVLDETGLPDRTADRLIGLYEATKAKLKRVKGPIVTRGTLIVFEQENPLTVSEDERSDLMDIIASLCEGETQASLMQELGITPKPKAMPKGKTPDGDQKTDEATAGQLAFHFFGSMAEGIMNTRTNPDYKKLLLALPVYSDSEHPLSLSSIEAETRALLADIEEAKQASAKPAKGKVITL